tara:strand:+ start:1043 stop:1774 length:732 start_codon:yes stop_codon:yes gene_type:complete
MSSEETTPLPHQILSSELQQEEDYRDLMDKIIDGKKIGKPGTLLGYLKEFLQKKGHKEWWFQPEFMKYAQFRVVEDGGVGWHNKSNGGKGKMDPDGTPATFGDGGRTIEQFRQEKYEGCFDNRSGKPEGPFRANIQKLKEYKGSTKSHSFNNAIKKEVTKRSNGRCEMCGHKGKIEIDHFVPKEKGGESTLKNANALCSRCNDRKCAKKPLDFIREEFIRHSKYFEDRGMKNEYKELCRKYCE